MARGYCCASLVMLSEFLLWSSAIGLALCGYILTQRDIIALVTVAIPQVAMGLGALALIIAIWGRVADYRRWQCGFYIMAISLIMLFLAEVLVVGYQQLQYSERDKSNAIWDDLDASQQQVVESNYQCCGWIGNETGVESNCFNSTEGTPDPDYPYSIFWPEGCKDATADDYKDWVMIVTVIFSSFAGFHLLYTCIPCLGQAKRLQMKAAKQEEANKNYWRNIFFGNPRYASDSEFSDSRSRTYTATGSRTYTATGYDDYTGTGYTTTGPVVCGWHMRRGRPRSPSRTYTATGTTWTGSDSEESYTRSYGPGGAPLPRGQNDRDTTPGPYQDTPGGYGPPRPTPGGYQDTPGGYATPGPYQDTPGGYATPVPLPTPMRQRGHPQQMQVETPQPTPPPIRHRPAGGYPSRDGTYHHPNFFANPPPANAQAPSRYSKLRGDETPMAASEVSAVDPYRPNINMNYKRSPAMVPPPPPADALRPQMPSPQPRVRGKYSYEAPPTLQTRPMPPALPSNALPPTFYPTDVRGTSVDGSFIGNPI